MGCGVSSDQESDMDKLYDDLLVELECPICFTYMAPPIRQCETGHSICEPCRKRLKKCPLCQGSFTDSKNISLEALSRKMHYPCINFKLGCPERLNLNNREEHEKNCPYRGYKCMYPKCPWSGKYEDISEHWAQKKNLNRPYRDTNVCHIKIQKSEQYFVNIIQAFDEIFWYKFNLTNGKLYWTVQFIGDGYRAAEFYFEIEIFKPGQPLRRYLLSEYCQPIDLPNSNLFKAGFCVITSVDAVNHFFGEDQLLIYYMRVKKVEGGNENRRRDQSTSRDSVCSEPASERGGGRGRRNYRGRGGNHNRRRAFNQNEKKSTVA